jgi:tetratricopeptide (TPR) repeat protein
MSLWGKIGNSLRFLPALHFVLLVSLTACTRSSGLPKPDSKEYRGLVTAFYVGLAGLQTGEDVRAGEKLALATQIAPGEPAGWANLGLLAVRHQEFDSAYEKVEKARTLAPDNSQIEALLGLIESKRGKLAEAIFHLKKAVELDGKNLKALYALARESERQAIATSDAEAQKLFERILEKQPRNLAALLEVARLAAKRGDGDALRKAVGNLAEASTAWPDEAKQQMSTLQQEANSTNPRPAALQVAFLRNVLARVPEYRQSLNAVRTPAEFVGEPFLTFIKLPSPSSEPAPPDLTTTFEVQPIPNVPEGELHWMGAVWFDDGGKASLLWADETRVQIVGGARLAFPGGQRLSSPVGPAVRTRALALDLNYDFKTDLVVTGAGGVRVYLRQNSGNFADITARSKLSGNVLNASYSGAWAIDVDLDGDLDILLGANSAGPVLLRNNADSTFAEMKPFKGLSSLAAFAQADVDGDGDPDVAMIDKEGQLAVFSNERLGQFHLRPLPPGLNGRFLAVAAGDVKSDGFLDFVVLKDNGSAIRLSDRDGGLDWDVAELVNAELVRELPGSLSLLVADFDNNGSLDLLVGKNQMFLGGVQGFSRLAAIPEIVSPSVVDINGDGKLDLIGLPREALEANSASARPIQLINRGQKNYRWQTIRTRAAKSTGDQRINSFGIGGEIEVRSGLLTQKQVITSQVVHFGLGEHTETDVARIVWPNGSVQAEFELKSDQAVLAEQRLKGSCPALFAWDGQQMSFVKDCAPWSPALGLHINAQALASIDQTEEWFKVSGERLVPREGYYDLRVTAELWETFYIDHYSLLAVDHPEGTEIFADERCAAPPPRLKIYATAGPKPFASAKDDRGQDVSAVVRDLDLKYLDTFGRGLYQGVTRDHWVELDLPESAPRDGPLYLIGHGWLHPTDATVNIALGQRSAAPPQGLSLEVPSSRGKWMVARSELGFPAGKQKTIVLDVTKIFGPNAPRKLRLRTNMEIYWDQIEWASGILDTSISTRHLNLSQAELHYRGFSAMAAANESSPEVPNYGQLEGTAQKWRDLEGYYTQYGDTRELLEKVDDRIVIMNAGDEMRLRFSAPPQPPRGWIRDFVMVGDGWIKDGDYNSVFSKTVLPLPYHGLKDYAKMPGRLEDDLMYRLHPQDWQNYHTRYVTPEAFVRALRK